MPKNAEEAKLETNFGGVVVDSFEVEYGRVTIHFTNGERLEIISRDGSGIDIRRLYWATENIN